MTLLSTQYPVPTSMSRLVFGDPHGWAECDFIPSSQVLSLSFMHRISKVLSRLPTSAQPESKTRCVFARWAFIPITQYQTFLRLAAYKISIFFPSETHTYVFESNNAAVDNWYPPFPNQVEARKIQIRDLFKP